ncbi:UNVERIFIED_CONTAM: hypothetical protein NCL1_40611 [Trichonephila clavipes]
MAPHTITPAVGVVCHCKAKAGLRHSPQGLPYTNTIVITAKIESGFVTKDYLVPFRCSPVSLCTAPLQMEVSMGRNKQDWLDGFSVFSVGPDGLIYKHVCDKMTPDDDTVKVKKVDLKSRLLGLLELAPRTPTPGSLHTLIPCYRIPEICNCKRLT